MENIFVIGQTSQLMAIGIVLLALCLGVIFYIWSLNLFKKIELLINKMKANVDSLENLSQSIYETAYFEMKGGVEHFNQKTTGNSQETNIKKDKISGEYKRLSSESNPKSTQFSQTGEEGKYQEISSLIITHLKELLQEKEQVTAQELVYAIPNHYSLADIYQTLEEMKEKEQIDWEDKSVSPQSILKLI